MCIFCFVFEFSSLRSNNRAGSDILCQLHLCLDLKDLLPKVSILIVQVLNYARESKESEPLLLAHQPQGVTICTIDKPLM